MGEEINENWLPFSCRWNNGDPRNPSIVKKVVESLGYRKVLYGCDGPYGMKKFNEYDYSAKKSWIELLQIPDNQKEYILGKNFLGLINWISQKGSTLWNQGKGSRLLVIFSSKGDCSLHRERQRRDTCWKKNILSSYKIYPIRT